MIPHFLTFTGLDAKADLGRAKALSDQYPIEWGVLYHGRIGTALGPRYPSDITITKFLNSDLRLAAHLCGRFARYALNPLMVDSTDIETRFRLWADVRSFDRVQINNAPYYDIAAVLAFQKAIGVPVIVQTRGTVFPSWNSLTCLHDESGGRGVVALRRPSQTVPMPLVGYAGGIGPDNVLAVIAEIDASNYYLDMESGIRTDGWLDLDKCEAVCRQVWSSSFAPPAKLWQKVSTLPEDSVMKYVIEGTLTDIETEDDDGRALIGHTQFDDLKTLGDDDTRFFVRLHSTQDDLDMPVLHPIMESLRSKRIRITVETLDEEPIEKDAGSDEPLAADESHDERDPDEQSDEDATTLEDGCPGFYAAMAICRSEAQVLYPKDNRKDEKRREDYAHANWRVIHPEARTKLEEWKKHQLRTRDRIRSGANLP